MIKLTPLLLILAGCSSTIVQYPSVCTKPETKCQRNLDAQTLAIIGNEEAALQLMCMDDELADVIGDDCFR